MKQINYKSVLDNAPIGYTYRRIIIDKDNNPCDFEFLDVNDVFEDFTGLKKEKIIGKKFSDIQHDIKDIKKTDYLAIYGDVAINQVSREFEQFSETTNKWYNVKAFSPEKYYFITYLTDISFENQLTNTADKLLQYSTDDIDYKKITNTLLDISGARYGILNLYNPDNKAFTTEAYTGIEKDIKLVEKMFGFTLTGKKWFINTKDPKNEGQKNIITHFNSLCEFADRITPKHSKEEFFQVAQTLEKEFDIGSVVVVKILKDDLITGNFILLMPKGVKLQNPEVVKLYARQIGLLLTHKKEEELLKDSTHQYKVLFESNLTGIFVIDKQTNKAVLVNNTIVDLFGLGSKEEAFRINPFDFIHPEDKADIKEILYKDVFEHDIRESKDFRAFTKDGRQIWLRMIGAKMEYKGKTAGLISLYDITEQKHAEEALQNKNKILNSLNDYSMELTSLSMSNEIFHVAAQKITELSKALGAIISYFDEKNHELVVCYTTLSDKENNKIKQILGKEITGLRINLTKDQYDHIINTKTTYKESLTETTFGSVSPTLSKILKKTFNYKWFGGIGLIYKNKLVGTIVFIGGKNSIKLDNESLETFAGITANALQRWFVEKSLIESEKKYRFITENTVDVIWLMDLNMKFTFVSPSVEKLYGYTAEEFMNLPFEKFLTKETINTIYETFDSVMKDEKEGENEKNIIKTIQYEAIKKDGSKFWLETNARLYRDNNQKPVGIIGVSRDITERIKSQNLQQEVEIARQSAQFKQNFLANMSHEIRTPLTGIIGMTELFSKTELTEKQVDYLNSIKQSSKNLREIINLILDYSKIEAGRITLKNTTFAVYDLFSNANNFFKSICTKNIDFETYISSHVPEYIQADKQRVTQILNNLIFNAVKYTEQGKIMVKADIETPMKEDFSESQTNYAIIRIEVKDTGIGIKHSKQKHLFKPFSQIEQEDTRDYEGTGLGLSICKELTKLLGGEIGVNSSPGKGSTFWYTFKAKIEKKTINNNQTNTPSTDYKSKPLEILFVEDNKVTQKVISLLLSSNGHKVTIAENGQVALDIFDPQKFDLVLMDIQMPVLDGINATKQLKEKYSDLPPIVGLSANAFEGDREKYMKQGLDESLTKPLDADEFYSVIKKLQLV